MRILLIKPGAIGDLLQLSPVIRAIKSRHPHARISMLVGNKASIDLYRYNPLVDELLVFDKRGEHRSWRSFYKLWKELKQRQFDLIINFQRSNLKAWLLAIAAFPCTVLVYHKAKGRIVHAVVNHLETIASLGIDPYSADQNLELHTGPDDVRWADQLLTAINPASGPLIALNLGASHPVNRWATSHFTELADRLHATLGAIVLLVGGNTDISLADQVLSAVTAPVQNLVDQTTLLQLGELLRRCSVVVSADTGPMHMATAVRTPVVALFGAADPARTGPVGDNHIVLQAVGLPCVPCRSRSCNHTPKQECMNLISVDMVFEAVRMQLGRNCSCVS